MSILKLWSSRHSTHERFESLMRPHLEQLYRLAYRLTGQRVDAEDLVQDVVLKLYPRLEELQSVDKPGIWLSRILYRHFIDKYRRQQRSPVQYTDEEQALYDDIPDEKTVEPMAQLDSELTQNNLQKALDQLNPEQRIVLILHEVEGYTLQEIHYMQDVAVGTLKSRLHRGQNKLREILNQMEPFKHARRVNQ